jgi:peptidoglycan/xylan/chitin deacetylase (PgdA/CDA1 family)
MHHPRTKIALTFDDGPSPWTPAILDLLAGRGARATFFVVGEAVERHGEIVRRALAEGHELGNHTQTHASASSIDDDRLRRELERANASIEGATGIVPRLARPPYGHDPDRFGRIAAELGLDTVMWSVTPEDWSGIPGEEIARLVLEQAEPGAIVLLHDGMQWGNRSTCTPTVEAVEAIVDGLDGYQFVTVSELR